MHIAAASAAAAVAAVDGAPVTPPTEASPQPARPRVTAARIIPEEAGDSLDCAGL